jgi:hypothetical protein
LNSSNDQEVKARKLIYASLILLVFEGLLRKLAPGGLSIVIFFLKDLLCLLGLYFIINTQLSATSKKTARVFKSLIILMYPLLLYNLFIDPILIVWGGKLYLLYCVMAILVTMAFPPDYSNKFVFFSILINSLIIIAVLVGLYQLNLPPSHWLNRGVGGESLEAFSAAGQLRISSTFSFAGQYAYFLVFGCSLFFSFFFFHLKNRKISVYYILINLFTLMLLLVGAFSTGGKTAVLGEITIILIGFLLIMFNNPLFAVRKLILPFLFLALLFPVLQTWKPEYFAAYVERSEGKGGSNDDILERVFKPFAGLIDGSFFGNGLGVMTNGSDKVSTYAASIRSTGLWTENDFMTIIWEGGLYLALIWYGFRLFIIFYSFRILRSLKDNNYYGAAAFLFAYILVQGLIGTFTLQPPVAIYFWICFGFLICIQNFDEFNQKNIIQEQ